MGVRLVKSFFVGLLVLKAAIFVLLFIILESFWIRMEAEYPVTPVSLGLFGAFLIPGFVVPYILGRQVIKGRHYKWSVWLLGLESVFSMYVLWIYFTEPMHDIALALWGHHGRFGSMENLGDPVPYLLYDATLPYIIVLPVFLMGIAYYALASRKPKRAPVYSGAQTEKEGGVQDQRLYQTWKMIRYDDLIPDPDVPTTGGVEAEVTLNEDGTYTGLHRFWVQSGSGSYGDGSPLEGRYRATVTVDQHAGGAETIIVESNQFSLVLSQDGLSLKGILHGSPVVLNKEGL